MNCEETRLRTFSSWPVNAPVCAQKLSASGFFSTGSTLEVECNWCHCRISDWKIGDDVEQRHVETNQQCEFILNRQNCGNFSSNREPNQPLLQEHLNRVDNDCSSFTNGDFTSFDLLVEKNRLATFVNWPNSNITPESLAKAGFFYRNRSDEVECVWCKGVIAKWEEHDNAFEEHRKFFPCCPRVLMGPLIETANDVACELGIQQITPPKNPKYSSLHARLRTYTNWPISDIQNPENLAQAGLYFQKVDDQVRCFHCNMGLRSWEKEDDPWFEHAKWYPKCDFVRLVKGDNYIKEVQEKTKNIQTPDHPIIPMSIEEAMTTEPIKIAIEMGVDSNALQNKTQQIIMETGRPYTTVEDLLGAVFDEENLNNDFESSNQNSFEISNISTCNDHNTKYGSTCISVNNVKDKHFGKVLSRSLKDVSEYEQVDKNAEHLLLEEENRKLKDARLCKVCLDEEVGVVYLPCGHLVTCVQCAPGVNQCPMCRTIIQGFVRTYLS